MALAVVVDGVDVGPVEGLPLPPEPGVAEARARCPGLVVLPMRTERYREVAQALLAVLKRWGPTEKTSYDDFYVDVTARVTSAVPTAVEEAGPSALPTAVRVWRAPGSGRPGRARVC